jgi:cytidine deaminase
MPSGEASAAVEPTGVSNRSLLVSDDEQLLNAARELIRRRFKEGRHHVAASLRDNQGKVFSAVHLEATVGRVAICAEAIALGAALVDGDAVIDAIVAVDRNGDVVPPCGMCREMIADYSPNARVIVSSETGTEAVPISSLLPFMGKRSIL